MDEKEYRVIPLDALKPYPGHIFAAYEGERLAGMIDSVREHGVITPIIVRMAGEAEYQILSGHNRVNAAKEAGLTEIKAVVHEGLNNAEAEFIVTETNLMQRSFADLKHSERAAALKNHLEAIQKSSGGAGFRSDLVKLLDDATLFPVETRIDSLKKVGEQYALSKSTAFRYVRLAKLPSALLAMVDDNRIPFRAAIEISFLWEDEMNQLASVLQENPKLRMTLKSGKALRAEAGRISRSVIFDILDGNRNVGDEPTEAKQMKRVSMSTSMLDRLDDHTNNLSGAIERIVRFYFRGLDAGEFGDILSELDERDAERSETEGEE